MPAPADAVDVANLEERWHDRQNDKWGPPPPVQVPIPHPLAPDHSQFTEEQKAEAYRIESMQLLVRQTRAVETIRTIMVIWAILTVIGVIMLIAQASSTSSF